MGLAVRAGAPKPDISTPEAFKRALLAAKSIVYTDPALGSPSGVHFAKVLERLGIAEEMKAKSKLHDGTSFNAELVAKGEIEIAIQQISEILPVRGAELVGPLPATCSSRPCSRPASARPRRNKPRRRNSSSSWCRPPLPW